MREQTSYEQAKEDAGSLLRGLGRFVVGVLAILFLGVIAPNPAWWIGLSVVFIAALIVWQRRG